ncbi:DUF6065 family protein [Kribbella sp. NPDC020789]
MPEHPSNSELPLVAYRLDRGFVMPLVPAVRHRGWMEAAVNRNPTHCLPLLLANQAGWSLLNPARFTAQWNGGERPSDLTVRYDSTTGRPCASSHFGDGILTFQIPYLFRTPPGWNLLARGPANAPKDGVSALEGIIETDWAAVTFTMNWKFTRPGSIAFEEGEPVCMVLPQRRHQLESFAPVVSEADQMPGYDDYLAWRTERHRFRQGGGEQRYQKDYMRGLDFAGNKREEHQTRLKLAAFVDSPSAGPAPGGSGDLASSRKE